MALGGASREFVLKIVGDVKDALTAVDKVGTETKTMKDKMVGIGKSVATGLAVGAVVAFGKASVDSAAEADEAMDKVQNVFGGASKSVIDFSQTVADKMGLSAQDYQAMAAQSGALMTSVGIGADDAAKSTEVLSQRAADLAAIYGGDAQDAMAQFDKAMTGQTKGLKQYGIVLSKAEIDQRAMAKGYVDASGKVTDAGRAIASQELILEKSAKQAGAFAENSGDLGSQQAILAAKMENLKTTIGNSLLPVIEKLISLVQPFLTFVQNNIGWLAPLAGILAGIVLGMKAWALAQAAWNAATTIATGIQWAFNAAMLANPIGLIIAAVAALVAGFVLLYTKVDWFRAAVDAAVSAILGALQWLWDWVSTNWPLLLAILTGPFGIAASLIIKNWDTIKNAALGVFDWIRDNWPLLLAILTGPFGLAVLAITRNWDTIRDFFFRLPGLIGGWLSNVGNIIAAPFKSGAQWAKDAFSTVTDFFYRLPGQINNWLSNVANIIKYPFTTAFDAIKSAWNNTIGRISFTVPSWVPGIGGKGWSAPRLAAGGIVNRPTLALIGEAGPEAVVPLNRLASTSDIGGPTYIINVYALTATAEVGRRVVESISEFERVSGRRVSSG
jgi:uncharacterized membrane-anchored protein YhcB (DUF1043 family)